MFQIDKTIISEDIIEEEFVCNLSACKGACCVAGTAGAPLTKSETELLEKDYPKIKPYLAINGTGAISKLGAYIKIDDKNFETPLVNEAECAYATFEASGTAKCGIEQAYNDGAINWKKPISCHLYPIRITEYSSFSAVNYHRWEICKAACALGEKLKIPVYRFLKEPLIKRFGQKWYDELEKIGQELQ